MGGGLIAVFIPMLEASACLGLGAVALRAAGVAAGLSAAERLFWAFAIGLGLLGWAVFFLGYAGELRPSWLGGLLALGACGVPLLAPFPRFEAVRISPTGLLLGLAAGAALVFDLAEGLSPPADADTLAYHFTMPRDWLAAGKLLFVPRAVDGAVPFLVNATYAPALALGGERALTLWTMLTGWAGAGLTFAVARRWLDREWAGAAALIYLTLPMVVYAGGSGQVEPRIALFATVALLAAAEARRNGRIGFALIAGLAAGFCIGAKYLGLLFAVPLGVVVLLQRRWLTHGLVFGAVALAAGFQWYGWNWLHSGDPVFPMLHRWLDGPYWSAALDAVFRGDFLRVEAPLPKSLGWFLAYPFHATLGSAEALEATRTGAGPYLLLVFPFAVAGLWRYRAHLAAHPLAGVGGAVLLYYGLWFFLGPSQRVRHLMPLMPLALVAATLAAHRWADAAGALSPLRTAAALTIVLQLGGHGVFAASYLRHLISGEGRDDFLARTVSLSTPVPWINAHLGPTDKVVTDVRQLSYLLTVPNFCANPNLQTVIGSGAENRDPALFLTQLRRLGASHVLITPSSPIGLAPLTKALIDAGCAERVQDFETRSIGSRTLPGMNTSTGTMALVKIGETCLR